MKESREISTPCLASSEKRRLKRKWNSHFSYNDMTKLKSLMFKDFEQSKMSNYSKVYGGILYTSHSGPPRTYDTKQTQTGPETATTQTDDSPVGASFQ
jgi:hypothetical protein